MVWAASESHAGEIWTYPATDLAIAASLESSEDVGCATGPARWLVATETAIDPHWTETREWTGTSRPVPYFSPWCAGPCCRVGKHVRERSELQLPVSWGTEGKMDIPKDPQSLRPDNQVVL